MDENQITEIEETLFIESLNQMGNESMKMVD